MERFSRDLVWRRTTAAGVEHMLLDDSRGLHARGTMAAGGDRPYTCRYTVLTDGEWATTTVDVETEGAGWRRRVRLERSGGGWAVTTNEHGMLDTSLPGIELPEALDEAVDVDLGYSPLFNTLPVRRRALLDQPVGTSETYLMAFIVVPELVVAPSEQTYTVLGDGRIRYASGDFTADLEFDPDGYVRHYPGLATRA
ncbi:MAG: hypothetical protein GEU94_15575 [Micromonosporaceae bacterium]|nr:hypothetical protein [Micromonosporaceae bacterium]